MSTFFEEDFDPLRPQMGRVSLEDEYLVRGLLRPGARTLPKSPSLPAKPSTAGPHQFPCLSDRALEARFAAVALGHDRPKHPPTVTKIISAVKSQKRVRELAEYMGRATCPPDMPTTFPVSPAFVDEYFFPLSCDQVIERLADWELLSDLENLSPEFQKRLSAGETTADFQSVPEKKRFHHVQAWHMVWPIAVSSWIDPYQSVGLLAEASRRAIDTLFTANGHRVLATIHFDKPKMPHVHLLIKAKSKYGRRLRLDKAGHFCDVMRVTLSDALASVGIETDPSRRIDRAELREDMAMGREPLKSNTPWIVRKNGSFDLSQRAPEWWSNYGTIFLRRRHRSRISRQIRKNTATPPPRPHNSGYVFDYFYKEGLVAQRKSLPRGLRLAFDEMRRFYRFPLDALKSWMQMAEGGAQKNSREEPVYPNRNFANWLLRHQPETFGVTKYPQWDEESFAKILAALNNIRLSRPSDRGPQSPHHPPMRPPIPSRALIEKNRLFIGRHLDHLASMIERHDPVLGTRKAEIIRGSKAAMADLPVSEPTPLIKVIPSTPIEEPIHSPRPRIAGGHLERPMPPHPSPGRLALHPAPKIPSRPVPLPASMVPSSNSRGMEPPPDQSPPAPTRPTPPPRRRSFGYGR